MACASLPPHVIAAYPTSMFEAVRAIAPAFRPEIPTPSAARNVRRSMFARSGMRWLQCGGAAPRQHRDRGRPREGDQDEDDEPGSIAAGRVTEMTDQHGRGRLSNAIRCQDHAQQSPEYAYAEQLRRD